MESLGEIWNVEASRKKKTKTEPSAATKISTNTRYLCYRQGVQFACIRQGIPLPEGHAPDSYRDSLTYDHLFIFEHESGALLNRANKDTPRFIGVLQLANGTYVLPHDPDFQRIYKDRQDVSKAWHVDDGEPYWCDAHANRMVKRHAKKSIK